MLVSILFPAPATSSRVIDVCWCGQHSSPRVHLVAFRLLQFSYTASPTCCLALQAVQNAVARLVTDTRRCDHITPVLQQLHWLPVRQPVEFELYKALNNQAPPYLSDDCQLVATTGRRQLPSSCRQFQVQYHWYQFTSWRSSIRCFRITPLEKSSYICPWTPSVTNWKRI